MPLMIFKLLATLLITLSAWWLRRYLQVSSIMPLFLAAWGSFCFFWAKFLGELGGVSRRQTASGKGTMQIIWMLAGAICWLLTVIILWREV